VPAKPRPDPKLSALRARGSLNARPENVRDDLFQDSTFFDPRDLVQVKYEMLRRVQADAQEVSRAAAAFGFSRPSFYKAQASFGREGLTGLVPKKRGPRGGHKLTERVMQFIQETREKDASLDARAVARLVEREFQLTVHPRSVERALRRRGKKRL
jgi:transposase